jgi:hypothetical protein
MRSGDSDQDTRAVFLFSRSRSKYSEPKVLSVLRISLQQGLPLLGHTEHMKAILAMNLDEQHMISKM